MYEFYNIVCISKINLQPLAFEVLNRIGMLNKFVDYMKIDVDANSPSAQDVIDHLGKMGIAMSDEI